MPGVNNRPGKTQGYILATRYYEQQGMALRSHLQLQCFGDVYGLQTVQPFVIGTLLGIPFDDLLSGKEPLTIGDVVDTDLWNLQTATEFGYLPMSQWNMFIQSAPRKVIVVCIKYRRLQGHPPRLRAPTPGFNYRTGCPQECYHKFNASIRFLGNYGFELVRKSCANFLDYGGSVAVSSFMENLLGKHKASEVTILVNEFRGFYGVYRLPVLSDCGIIHHDTKITVFPSNQLQQDTKNYIRRVLHDDPYIGVLVRIEKLVQQRYNISVCTRQLVDLLTNLSSALETKNYFLAMDVGKFGSRGAALMNLLQYGEQLFTAVYEELWSFQQWENSFEQHASCEEVAYVANLQKALATKAQCLVVIGGGQFQEQAVNLYRKFHPHPDSHCLHALCAPPIEDW